MIAGARSPDTSRINVVRRARGSGRPATRRSTRPTSTLGIGSASARGLTPGPVARIDAQFRMRAEAVAVVDGLMARVQTTLAARGLAGNTHIVFSSDDGYHMGQHRLLPGKETAFDPDIRGPLIMRVRAYLRAGSCPTWC